MIAKKIGFFSIILVSLLIINNLAQSIYDLRQKNSLVESVRLDVEEEKRRNKQLKNKISQIDDIQFIEQEARNKLFLTKPGEKVLVLSDKAYESTASSESDKDTRANWKKWWDLFF